MATYAERLEAGLLRLGWTLDRGDKSRYRAFVKAGEANKLFVGPSGALRTGECASRSFSIGDPSRITRYYKTVLSVGDKALDPLAELDKLT